DWVQTGRVVTSTWMIPRKAQRSEVLVESAGALAKEAVEVPPLLLLNDGLLLFARLDYCSAAIDIGLGVGGAFRPARRIILAGDGRPEGAVVAQAAAATISKMRKSSNGSPPRANPCSRFWPFGDSCSPCRARLNGAT